MVRFWSESRGSDRTLSGRDRVRNERMRSVSVASGMSDVEMRIAFSAVASRGHELCRHRATHTLADGPTLTPADSTSPRCIWHGLLAVLSTSSDYFDLDVLRSRNVRRAHGGTSDCAPVGRLAVSIALETS